MTNDAKEWVTVKLPKEVRDDAQDDPRTYGEIMRVGVAVLQHPLVDTTANEPTSATLEEIMCLFDDLDEKDTPIESDGVRENREVAMDGLREQLDRIESAAKEATNAAQSAEHAIDNMGGR